MITDYLEDENGDIIIEDGDVLTGDATKQTVKELCLAVPSEYRLDPMAGADVQSEVNDDGNGGGLVTIKRELHLDGARLVEYSESGEGLYVDAKYL